MGNSAINYSLTDLRVIRSKKITEAMTGTTAPIIEIPAGTLVLKCWIVITTLFAGGTPSLDIGDGDDVDGWIDSVDITEATAGTYGATETNTGAYSDAGKYYAARDTIDVVMSAAMSSGVAYVFALVVDVAGVISD